MHSQLALFHGNEEEIPKIQGLAQHLGLSLVVNHLSEPIKVAYALIDHNRIDEVLSTHPNLMEEYQVIVLGAKKELSQLINFYGAKALGFLALEDSLCEKWGDLFNNILDKKSWGLSEVCDPEIKVEITNSSDKASILYNIEKWLDKQEVNSRIAGQVLTVADELIMNAFYDAPVDDNGVMIFKQKERSEAIVMPEDKKISIEIATDKNQNICLCVQDQYGSLSASRLVKHLGKKYQREEYTPDANYAGAGLGLVSALINGVSLSFKVVPKEKTEVLVMFPKTTSYRDYKKQSQFILSKTF